MPAVPRLETEAAPRELRIAGGTVPGAEHLRAGRNNQDAFGWLATPAATVAVVCDGCGSGSASELGARLAATLLPPALERALLAGASPGRALERARLELLATLRNLALASTPAAAGPEALARYVIDHLLFTVVGVAIAGDEAFTFAAGDGVIAVNGEVEVLGPFPGNRPPYLAYGLLAGDAPRLELRSCVARAELRSVLLGTDGVADLVAQAERPLEAGVGAVGPLARFWEDPAFVKNPDMIRRRLVLVARGGRHGRLPDDTTLVVIRRDPGEGGA